MKIKRVPVSPKDTSITIRFCRDGRHDSYEIIPLKPGVYDEVVVEIRSPGDHE